MKITTLKSINRFLSICLVLLIGTFNITPAFATEVSTDELSTNSVAEFAKDNGYEVLSSESPITREEALDSLGMTEEEAKDGTIYVKEEIVSVTNESEVTDEPEIPIDPNPYTKNGNKVILGHNDKYQFPSFTFSSGHHTGGNLMAFNTGLAHFGVKWYWLNPIKRSHAILIVNFCDGNGTSLASSTSGSAWGSSSVNTDTSSKFRVSRSKSYHFTYETRLGYYEPGFAWPKVKVIMTIYGD